MKSKNYFQGWYFKCVYGSGSVAFIVSYHVINGKTSALLQIITNNGAFNLPFSTFEYTKKPFCIKIGKCTFSEKGIILNIQREKLTATGVLKFAKFTPIKYDIMGPFKYVPFMECRHSVYSMNHIIDGKIKINDCVFNFNYGTGYIEGDRGYSFPKKYIWTQCNFESGSIMLSVAKIPIFDTSFNGIICVILLDGKEYRIASYLGAKVSNIGKNSVTVKQGNLYLTARLIQKNSFPLYAPTNAKMIRTIHESVSCKAYYKFTYKNAVLCEFTSDNASFEYEF